MAQIGQQLRSTNKPIYGASTVTINNTIYIYGGFYNIYPWDKEALWTLSNSIDKLSQINTDPFASPAVIYHSLLSTDNETMFTFGGHLIKEDIFNPPPNNISESIRYYKFNFNQLTWKPLQKKNITAPLERFWHTTIQFNQTIYLYGGINITGNGFLDFWKYNPILDDWIKLQQLEKGRCGHTSTMTDDGKMIILGGFDCTNSLFLYPKDKLLYPLSNALIFNSITNIWYNQSLTGMIPSSRTFHTAIKSNNNSIVICGGQDYRVEPLQTYISGTEMTAILNLITWEWNMPYYSLYQPFPSSFSISTIINNTKMIYGLGLNDHTVYDGFYIFDLETTNWISPNNLLLIEQEEKNTTIISTIIYIISLIILFISIIWITSKYYNIILKSIKKNIWNQRKGEPLWAEITRLLFRFLFLSLFILICIVLVLQVKNSPIIHQTYHDTLNEIISPNIRFCFDGLINQSSPILQCTTDFGQSCNENLIDITEKVNTNLDYFGKELHCYLFIGGNKLKLGNNRLSSNGSLIQFYYYGNSSIQSKLYIELYHPFHDPNIPVYNISSPSSNSSLLFDNWYSIDEYSNFVSNEKMNLKSNNIFIIDIKKESQIGYELKRIEKINLNIWNYFGFKSNRDILNQIQTMKYKEIPLNEKESTFLGSLNIFPTSKDIIVIREKRAFTIIHAIGIIGGIFGLIIGFQANLFGYRPRSPWGIIHRWSIRLMRKSLLIGLRKRFTTNQIPIVQPIQSLMNDDETEEERMIRLEQRLQVFEFLFQAYYIDDEIFLKAFER